MLSQWTRAVPICNFLSNSIVSSVSLQRHCNPFKWQFVVFKVCACVEIAKSCYTGRQKRLRTLVHSCSNGRVLVCSSKVVELTYRYIVSILAAKIFPKCDLKKSAQQMKAVLKLEIINYLHQRGYFSYYYLWRTLGPEPKSLGIRKY